MDSSFKKKYKFNGIKIKKNYFLLKYIIYSIKDIKVLNLIHFRKIE